MLLQETNIVQVIKYPENQVLIQNPITPIDLKKELYQIDYLRAVAATGVCLFHFTCGNSKFLPHYNLIYETLRFGYLGVDIFFIVSGFIICYSFPKNYKIISFFSFFKKRLLRVHPPYLMSIALTILVAYTAAIYTHNPVHVSGLNLLYHFFYLNNFTDVTYITGVYWTLGIEFQFYIIIGLLFNLMNKSVYYLSGIIIILLFLNWIKIDTTNLILEHTPLFCIGILLYFYLFDCQYPKVILLFLLATSLAILGYNQTASFYTSLFTICIIYIPFTKNKFIQFLSGISYSLYLVHIPVGGRVINLCLKFTHNNYEKYLAVFIALVVSIITAYFFHFIIEKPAIRWSKKVKYFRAG
ncbi:MAG: acyltransferase [Sphingobacteriaceae bacterium]|nr:MAG: acyltransferase [Sphingobacteriaceae bacterium]